MRSSSALEANFELGLGRMFQQGVLAQADDGTLTVDLGTREVVTGPGDHLAATGEALCF